MFPHADTSVILEVIGSQGWTHVKIKGICMFDFLWEKARHKTTGSPAANLRKSEACHMQRAARAEPRSWKVRDVDVCD